MKTAVNLFTYRDYPYRNYITVSLPLCDRFFAKILQDAIAENHALQQVHITQGS